MPEDPANHHQITMLRDALLEAQTNVRAYDTKAQIVGVGYIFSLSIISQIGALLGSDTTTGTWLTIVLAWGIAILPIVLFGFVLYPTRYSAPSLGGAAPQPSIQHALYVQGDRGETLASLAAALDECDYRQEYTYELLKVSRLREKKRRQLLRALFSVALAYGALFLAHLAQAIGLI